MTGRYLFLCVAFGVAQLSGQPQFPKIDEAVRLKRLEPPTGKVRMVLDTDAYNEIDDQFALAYALLSSEKLEVEAVYAAPFLNARATSPGDGMEKSYREILRILEMVGKSSAGFTFRGSDKYLEDRSRPVRSDAVTDLVDRVRNRSAGDPLYIVAVGCVTNVASALLLDPRMIEKVVVVWLGGNGLAWPNQREFNLRQDTKAAQVLFDSGVPLVVLPCQPVISHFHTTVPELRYYLEGKNALSDYLLRETVRYSGGREPWSKQIWDVTAVAWSVNSAWIPTNLEHSPILNDGNTFSVDHSRHLIRMAFSVHRDPIFGDLFSKLGRE